ncbi:MAG: pyrimidine-nucleoside phosphorylase, partial [Moorella sp. (in: Bacteria)]|nr:pyrimidine-nucleoside phosphorylase [Moorella sp. (in: firmicutes)]
NALEVREALHVLRGGGPRELREVCLTLGSQMLLLAGAAGSSQEARRHLEDLLAGGRALAKMRQFIAAQGGDPAVVDRPELLPAAGEQVAVTAPAGGYISAVQARLVGEAALLLGAGRLTKESPIDLAAGIELKKRRGHYVNVGEPLAVFHVNDRTNLEVARERFLAAYNLATEPPAPQPLVYEIIDR